MSLSAIILFGPPGFLFALKMTTHRKSEIIGGKAIRAIQLDLPSCQPVKQTFKSGLVTIPTFPVNQLACITAISFPDPELWDFFEVVPHFVKLHDNHSVVWRFRFGGMRVSKRPDPFQDCRWRKGQQFGDGIH